MALRRIGGWESTHDVDIHGKVLQCELPDMAHVAELLRTGSASPTLGIVVEGDKFVSGGVGAGGCGQCEVLVESSDLLLRIGIGLASGTERYNKTIVSGLYGLQS